MPSRINMGPDGGPYIAINENSGNIELEDNTGTTVAIWDDTNSQWDFQNNPISNVDSLTSNSLNTDQTDSKVINDQIVRGDHADFATAQDALDFANNNNHNTIQFPPGDYGPISTYQEQRIVGTAGGRGSDVLFDGGTTAHAIDLARNSTVMNVRAETTAGGGSNFNAINHSAVGEARIVNCFIFQSDNDGIFVDGDKVIVQRCEVVPSNIDGNDIILTSNSSNSIVDTNIGATIVDNGTGNVVGDNA